MVRSVENLRSLPAARTPVATSIRSATGPCLRRPFPRARGSGVGSQQKRQRPAGWTRRVCGLVVFVAVLTNVQAIPYYARQTGLSCVDCHVAGPKLNRMGEDFLARGYRLAGDRVPSGLDSVPVSVWITGRYEERSEGDLSKFYVPRVELISGGPIGSLPLSYFVEWRVVSLDMRGDGSLRDRGGRFEDAFVDWQIDERHGLQVGQFRSLNQYDVSLRLSVSEPVLFSAGLPGDPTSNPRITSLRAFSSSGRSPGITYSLQSIHGPAESDGLFHFVNVPFVGELSLPLSDEARREASFELHGPPKGVFLETFYRRELNSIGAHAFLGDGRWLVTGVGRLHYADFHATGGVGMEDARGRSSRMRYSLEVEYLPTWYDWIRPGLGFRVEHISNAGRDPAYIPYLVLAGPNTRHTVWLQVEGRVQGDNHGVLIDLSFIF
jgi:hypothetical protein